MLKLVVGFVLSLVLQVAGQTSTNTCKYGSDGNCDDGGRGRQYFDCAFGMDCMKPVATAAREAAFSGVPAVALSLYTTGRGTLHWETAQHVAARVVARVVREGLPRYGFLNVNVPNVPLPALRGIVVVPMGVRVYTARVDRREDPFGHPYFWLGGEHSRFDEDPDTDGRACEQGWATVTPMSVDATDRAALAALAGPGFPELDG
jgi:5'-nucleotidase